MKSLKIPNIHPVKIVKWKGLTFVCICERVVTVETRHLTLRHSGHRTRDVIRCTSCNQDWRLDFSVYISKSYTEVVE